MAEYNERQFAACGVPFHQKAGRLNESIVLMRRLWSETSLAFDGKYYRFKEIGVLPKPIQKPGIPIWIAGGSNDNALRRVARLADGWMTIPRSIENFVEDRQKIDSYARELGRQDATRGTAIYISVNLNEDGATARDEGWRWMEQFFKRPRSAITHQTALFGTAGECADTLRRYIESWSYRHHCKNRCGGRKNPDAALDRGSATAVSGLNEGLSAIDLQPSPCAKDSAIFLL
jgi:alkanesulfonate monooxygenase SsuD/methylene tetrahydromethanopterin reductase-like flavin-dependent oxidoreductase (luciferase family)